MLIRRISDLSREEKAGILGRNKLEIGSMKRDIEAIIEDVKKRGDQAVIDYTKKFDKIELRISDIRVSEEEIDNAFETIDRQTLKAIKKQISYSKKFHKMQNTERSWEGEIFPGLRVGQRIGPIESAGLYVPGGTAPYPTVMQILAVPAKIAGVEKIVACTPRALPEVLVAARLAGVDEVYRVGGPQAIAAMAYGTETIPKVCKIVGPGNIYVTTAKILVGDSVAIDMPAGPSEAIILADKTANPVYVAADILARAEHDKNAAGVLVTDSKELADKVNEEVERQKQILNRREQIDVSLSRNSILLVARDMEEAINFTNQYASEHLEIQTRNPRKVMSKIKNAGSIFLGNYAPVAVGDYASGVNHVLPTAQFAKMYSGVGVDTFLKKSEYEYPTKRALERLNKEIVERLAAIEGFDGHARSVSIRFKK